MVEEIFSTDAIMRDLRKSYILAEKTVSKHKSNDLMSNNRIKSLREYKQITRGNNIVVDE